MSGKESDLWKLQFNCMMFYICSFIFDILLFLVKIAQKFHLFSFTWYPLKYTQLFCGLHLIDLRSDVMRYSVACIHVVSVQMSRRFQLFHSRGLRSDFLRISVVSFTWSLFMQMSWGIQLFSFTWSPFQCPDDLICCILVMSVPMSWCIQLFSITLSPFRCPEVFSGFLSHDLRSDVPRILVVSFTWTQFRCTERFRVSIQLVSVQM